MAEIVEVSMPPFGKARPRVTKRGTYMPQKYQERRDALRLMYLAGGGAYADTTEPVALSADFFFRMPKSWSKKKKGEMDGAWCEKTPDIDNLIGAVMDALFEDDKKVVVIRARKFWGINDIIQIGIADL